MRNESATVPTAIPPISFSGKRNQRPKMPLMAAPASGSRGTSQMYLNIRSNVQCRMSNVRRRTFDFGLWTLDLGSPLHQINLINPDRFAVAIKGDHDPESNRCFCRSHDNHEDCEHLSGYGIAATRVLQVT